MSKTRNITKILIVMLCIALAVSISITIMLSREYEALLADYESMITELKEENECLTERLKNEPLVPVDDSIDMTNVMKPIIYLYPEIETDISIGLGNPDKLTCTYPKYNNSWNVKASPNGTLYYNDREYYGLYWEGSGSVVDKITEGFCVEGAETSRFLEEKLSQLGLSEREANEFIVYWLPKMENNPYNIIYFATEAEQNNYMPLDIRPAPETLIRVNMIWKCVDSYTEIPAQAIIAPERIGYTVVEWGGSQL